MDKPPKPNFTIEDVLAEAAAREGEETGGRTVRELIERTGYCGDWVRSWLREKIARGEVEYVGLRDQAGIDQRNHPAPAYRMRKSLQIDSKEQT